MLVHRCVNEKEFLLLLSGETIFGRYNCQKDNQCGLDKAGYFVCAYDENIIWHDKHHFIPLLLDIPDDECYHATSIYFAAKSFKETREWTGRRGNTEYEIKETFFKEYNLDNLVAVSLQYFNQKFAKWFLDNFHSKYDAILNEKVIVVDDWKSFDDIAKEYVSKLANAKKEEKGEMMMQKTTCNVWHDISAKRITPEDFICVVEIPKGSRNKYELDKESGCLILDRVLHTSTQYPANYGFIPRTYGDDNDPLDVMLLCSEPIQPLTLVRAYPIGVIKMLDNGKNDEKIIAVPFGDPYYNCYNDISELPHHMMLEMEHFFTIYKALENKETVVNDQGNKDEALRVITSCMENYDKMLANNKVVKEEKEVVVEKVSETKDEKNKVFRVVDIYLEKIINCAFPTREAAESFVESRIIEHKACGETYDYNIDFLPVEMTYKEYISSDLFH